MPYYNENLEPVYWERGSFEEYDRLMDDYRKFLRECEALDRELKKENDNAK